MPGKRMPIDLLTATGRKHLTQQEINERRETEVRADEPKRVLPPKSLTDPAMRKEFSELARQLVALKIFTKLDRDMLAAYLRYRSEWERVSELVDKALLDPETLEDAEALSKMQARFWTGCKSCADALGLNITSRCRLVLPKQDTAQPEDEMESLIGKKYG